MKCPRCKKIKHAYEMVGCFIDGKQVEICEDCVEEDKKNNGFL